MCGRFVGFRKIEELIEHFPIDISNVEVTANFNVAPSQEILAIIRHDKQNQESYASGFRITGIRWWIGITDSLASLVRMVQDRWSGSLPLLSQTSHRPAKANGLPFGKVRNIGCFCPFFPFHS